MSHFRKLIWNLFRLGLALGFCILLVMGLVYIFQGRFRDVSVVASVMGMLFFSINIANFWQYRWAESGTTEKAIVLTPLILSGGAVAASLLLPVPAGMIVIALVVGLWFGVTRLRPDLASSRVPARLLLTDSGVRRMYANVELDSIEWDDLVCVAASSKAEGPFRDDLFFFLEDSNGEGATVPNKYAVELLSRLQRLPGFDNEALVEAATDDGGNRHVLWKGKAGVARICNEA